MDIYIPSINTGIEYDGQRWHKDTKKDLIKDKCCYEKGINLIRIRENKLPQLNSTSIVFETVPSKDNHLSLQNCILSILK